VELSVGGLRVASRLVRVLPAPVAAVTARGLGRAAVPISRDQRIIAERNMRRVLGPGASERQVQRAVRSVFESYARYWLDTLRLPSLGPAEVASGFTIEGSQHLRAATDRGVGPILALPHVGGWEWAGRWLSEVQGWNVTAVAERLDPPELFDWFVELREELGMRIVALGPSAGSETAAALAAGDVVCLLCDRDLTRAGPEITFFGETTSLPAGPAVMALRGGCRVLPTAVYFTERGVHGVVRPPIEIERTPGATSIREDVVRFTQVLATELEGLIARAPEQWHLLQPNWPSDYEALGITPPPRRG